jgi:hypothetical protein
VEAERTGGTAWPAGAGGGDVLLYAGRGPSAPPFRELARRHGHRLLALSLDARGVHRFEGGDPGAEQGAAVAGKKAASS